MDARFECFELGDRIIVHFWRHVPSFAMARLSQAVDGSYGNTTLARRLEAAPG